MPLSIDDYNRRSTYFGVFSAVQAGRISELLDGLSIRYEFALVEQDEERLRAWSAWESTASNPREGHELYIHSDDLAKLGNQIVDMYPERLA